MRCDDGRVVSNFIVQALKNEDITIYGDGKQTRSFCYVDDLIEGIIAMMSSREGFTGPVNLGNPDRNRPQHPNPQVLPLLLLNNISSHVPE